MGTTTEDTDKTGRTCQFVGFVVLRLKQRSLKIELNPSVKCHIYMYM